MPITGKFEADFAAFNTAVDGATVKLKGFEANSVKVESSLSRMTSALSGNRLIQDALLMAEAIERVGGVSKLTEAELQRVAATVDEASAKMRALGVEVPEQFGEITAAAKDTTRETNTLHSSFSQFDSILQAMGVHIGPEVKGLGELEQAAGKTATQIGLLGTAGLVVGAALGGWKLGRMIAEFFSLDEIIGRATATLFGFGDVAAQEAGAKADILAQASAHAGVTITDLTTALAVNAKWLKESQTAAADTQAAFERMKAPEKAAADLAKWAGDIKKITDAGLLKTLTKDIESNNFSVATLAERYGIAAESVQFFGRELDRAAAITANNAKQLAALQATIDKNAAKRAEATEHLNALDQTSAQLLINVDSQVRMLAEHYLDLGASVRDVQTAYNLSDAEVRGLTLDLQEAHDRAEKLKRPLDDGAASFATLKAVGVDAMTAISMSAGALASDVDAATKNVRTLSGALMSAAQAKAAFDAGGSFAVRVLTAADAASTGGLTRLKAIEDYYAVFPGARPGGSGPTGLTPGDSAGWTRLLKMQEEYLALRMAHDAGIPGFAGGVDNFGGGLAWVGERGPELLALPRGASVFPAGNVSPGVNVVNTFHIVDTEAGITRRVSEAITRSILRGVKIGAA